MGNPSKSNFLLQRDLEHYPINWQESRVFLFFLQSIQPQQLFEACLKAHCNPNVHCSTQFYATLLRTKTFVLWVYTSLEEEKSIFEFCHYKKTPNFLINFLSASSMSSTMQDKLL